MKENKVRVCTLPGIICNLYYIQVQWKFLGLIPYWKTFKQFVPIGVDGMWDKYFVKKEDALKVAEELKDDLVYVIELNHHREAEKKFKSRFKPIYL